MRILKILSGKDAGGVLAMEAEYIKKLNQRGYKIDMLIIEPGPAVKEYSSYAEKVQLIESGLADFSQNSIQRIFSVFKNHFQSKKLHSAIRKNLCNQKQYAAIFLQRNHFLTMAGLIGKTLNAPVYWHLPNTINSSIGKLIYKNICSYYGITPIANSLYTKKTLWNDRFPVIYPGYSKERLELEQDMSLRNKLNISSNRLVYGIASRVHHSKAQDIVLDAFIKSNAFRGGSHLIIAGGPINSEFAENLKEKALAMGKGQIHIVGEIKNISSFYNAIDFAINGRRDVEPFGISIAEAMACGKPVIAYHLGGPNEMIVHEKNGWLVKEPTVEAYKYEIDKSFEVGFNADKMSEYAKKTAEIFEINKQIDKIENLIKRGKYDI